MKWDPDLFVSQGAEITYGQIYGIDLTKAVWCLRRNGACLHRTDGPAIMLRNGECQWWVWVDDKLYNAQYTSLGKFCRDAKLTEEEKLTLILQWRIVDDNLPDHYTND